MIDYNARDESIRNEFIARGYIETIIQLPASILHETTISPLLVVLSFRNEKIEFNDASNMYSQKGRMRYFSEKDIQSLLKPDYSLKATVPLKTVLDEERIMPAYHCTTSVDNGIQLSEVSEIHRGFAYSRKLMDHTLTDEDTSFELIRTSHIKGGEIVDNDYLSELPRNSVIL